MPTTNFAMVKQILDDAIAGWKARTGTDPFLSLHDDSFGWDTKQQLADSLAFGEPVIDPTLVGNGKAEQTNLIQVLRHGIPLSRNKQMPKGGPFLTDDHIKVIATWIDENLPD